MVEIHERRSQNVLHVHRRTVNKSHHITFPKSILRRRYQLAQRRTLASVFRSRLCSKSIKSKRPSGPRTCCRNTTFTCCSLLCCSSNTKRKDRTLHVHVGWGEFRCIFLAGPFTPFTSFLHPPVPIWSQTCVVIVILKVGQSCTTPMMRVTSKHRGMWNELTNLRKWFGRTYGYAIWGEAKGISTKHALFHRGQYLSLCLLTDLLVGQPSYMEKGRRCGNKQKIKWAYKHEKVVVMFYNWIKACCVKVNDNRAGVGAACLGNNNGKQAKWQWKVLAANSGVSDWMNHTRWFECFCGPIFARVDSNVIGAFHALLLIQSVIHW